MENTFLKGGTRDMMEILKQLLQLKEKFIFHTL